MEISGDLFKQNIPEINLFYKNLNLSYLFLLQFYKPSSNHSKHLIL